METKIEGKMKSENRKRNNGTLLRIVKSCDL